MAILHTTNAIPMRKWQKRQFIEISIEKKQELRVRRSEKKNLLKVKGKISTFTQPLVYNARNSNKRDSILTLR